MTIVTAAEEIDAGERVLRSYRRARTYPKTIRKLANLDLPYPVTIPQLATWIALFALLWYSRPLWVGVGGSIQVLILLVLPTAAAIALRHLRLEGRSPTAMTAGLLALLYAPRTGVVHGHPIRVTRPARYGALVVIEELPPAGTATQALNEPGVPAGEPAATEGARR